jgi:hypothetical protein
MTDESPRKTEAKSQKPKAKSQKPHPWGSYRLTNWWFLKSEQAGSFAALRMTDGCSGASGRVSGCRDARGVVYLLLLSYALVDALIFFS